MTDENKKSIFYNLLRISSPKPHVNGEKRKWYDILCEQIVDSLIIGGISGASAYVSAGEAASYKTFGLAFLITFLIKLKEYRGLR